MVQVDGLSKLLFCPSHITQSGVRNHFNTLQPRQMKLGRIEKVKTGSMFFFSMTSCALTVHAISAASREGHPRVPETKIYFLKSFLFLLLRAIRELIRNSRDSHHIR